jgi:hypothetical protein
MLARTVRMMLRPGGAKGFARTIDDEVVPVMK